MPAVTPSVTPISSALFVSDTHVSELDPQSADRFSAFLLKHAPQHDALYILGDLFDAWPGDDLLDQANQDFPVTFALVNCLKELSQVVQTIGILHGNRDFLLGAKFAHALGSNVYLLPDPSLIRVANWALLISHGDQLCTDDTDYQRARSVLRSPAWQAEVLAKSLTERLALARNLRGQSEHAKSEKSMDIMDVNQHAVQSLMAKHPNTHLIHGHTHRPGQHRISSDSNTSRYVLSDWSTTHGAGLAIRGNQISVLQS